MVLILRFSLQYHAWLWPTNYRCSFHWQDNFQVRGRDLDLWLRGQDGGGEGRLVIIVTETGFDTDWVLVKLGVDICREVNGLKRRKRIKTIQKVPEVIISKLILWFLELGHQFQFSDDLVENPVQHTKITHESIYIFLAAVASGCGGDLPFCAPLLALSDPSVQIINNLSMGIRLKEEFIKGIRE